MAKNLNQINGPKDSPDNPGSNTLNRVLERNRMTQVRREIGIIADRSYHESLISEEAYKGYRELAEGREEHEIGAEMLENTREFAEEHEAKAVRIHRKIQSAVTRKIASETDEEFLMEKLVIENMKFTEQAEKIEALIDGKLERMRKDRERYDKLADHHLIRDVGYLKVDGNTRIDFPSEEKFLEMTVPERRELLEEMEASLPKAEIHAKEREEREDRELIEKYEMKLDEAVKEGIIGKHTYDGFLNGFKKIDHEEKEYWDQEFDSQMERYRELWTRIRNALKGEALKKIEGMINVSGYTEIFSAFGHAKNLESGRLKAGYAKNLEAYRQEGVIGRHTVAQFTLWMGQQDLAGQYEAEEELPQQMLRYEKLWQKIGRLPKKQQDSLRSKIDDWGYTELEQEYNRFAGKGGADNENPEDEAIHQIQSQGVKEAIVETDDILDEDEGSQKRKTFINLLDKMFRRANRDTFDATSFEAEIREKAIKVNPDMKRDLKGRGADDEVDFEQIEGDTEILEQAGSARVVQDQGFIEVESTIGNQTTRHTQVTINEGRGLERLLSENGKNSYRAAESGGNDDLSLAIYSSGKTIELDLREVRTLQDYLEKTEEKDRLDKAA